MSSPETLRVMCPNLTCRKILAVPESARGKTVRCRGCATNIRVPGGASAGATDTGSSGKADSKPSTKAA